MHGKGYSSLSGKFVSAVYQTSEGIARFYAKTKVRTALV